MNTTSKLSILFLSLLDFDSLDESNIYTDLLREFSNNGHFVTVISPVEKRNWNNNKFYSSETISIYKPLIGNVQKTNIFEKGLSTVALERKLIKHLKKINNKFDLVLYSTPPVTFEKCIRYIKRRDNAISYLLLKDIFPQNAVDLGILKDNIIGKLILKYFRIKEVNLYRISDYIGCMSPANREYILKHNNLKESQVEVNPNSESPKETYPNLNKEMLFDLYNIPNDKKIFIYGGNFGKPQGVEFIKQCLLDNENKHDIFFVLVGSGTEFANIQKFVEVKKLKKTKILPKLSKENFEMLVQLSDVGLIFLDNRFTIPNFPSRLLTYMKFKKPVLMAIDRATDIGIIARNNNYGDFVYSDNVGDFSRMVDSFARSKDLIQMGNNGYVYFNNNYISSITYNKIISKMGFI
jgi:glycosyltransferase involved in cell wall biosynthesis